VDESYDNRKPITKNWIVNGTIGYVQDISIKKINWIHYDELMHPPTNILVDFNEFI
jgi:hypothetical protein